MQQMLQPFLPRLQPLRTWAATRRIPRLQAHVPQAMQAQMLRERGHQRVWGVRYEREGGRGPPSHAPVVVEPSPTAQWPPAAAASDRLPAAGDAGHISYTASAFTPPPQQQQQPAQQPSASTVAADAAADVTPRALREELRDLDAEMNSLHQSLYDAAARFGAALPRSELGAAPVATAARDVPLP